MASVFDSAPLPWHDLRVQKLREALTEAYPSGIKAEDIASRVKGFPLREVTWDHQDGASATWKAILTCAARAGALQGLLEQVLSDQTVAAFHTKIEAIIAESNLYLDPAEEAQPNSSAIRPPPQPAEVDKDDGDLAESLDQTPEWGRAISDRCRKALESAVPAAVASPDLAAEVINEALAALREVENILNALSVAALANAADPGRYACLSQTAESLRASRDAASGTLRRLRRAQRSQAASRLCDTLAHQRASLYTDLESAFSLLR